jgi:hypothetical protein
MEVNMAKFKVMATLLTINTIMKIVEATDMKEATRRVLDSSSFQD